MKRRILNPYTEIEGYNCFGCSPNNVNGLQMDFFEVDEYIISEWLPKLHFQGYNNVLHGGIQAALMDEIASWCAQIKLKTAGVTSKMETKFKKPVYCNKGKITLKALLTKTRINFAEVHVELFDGDGELCSESDVINFMYSIEIARKRFYYPDYNSFF